MRIASVAARWSGWFRLINEWSNMRLYFGSYGSFGSAGIFEMKGTRFEEWIEVEKVFGLYRGILFWWTNEIIVGNIDPFLLHEFVHFFFFFFIRNEYLLVWNVNVTVEQPNRLNWFFFFFFCAIIKNVQVFLTKLILVFIQTEKIIITFD